MKHLFNNYDRETAIKLLKKAKRLIRDLKDDFVCIALIEAAQKSDRRCAMKVSIALRNEIDARIHPYGTVSFWLAVKHDVELLESPQDIRDYRIRWIDSMIKELK